MNTTGRSLVSICLIGLLLGCGPVVNDKTRAQSATAEFSYMLVHYYNEIGPDWEGFKDAVQTEANGYRSSRFEFLFGSDCPYEKTNWLHLGKVYLTQEDEVYVSLDEKYVSKSKPLYVAHIFLSDDSQNFVINAYSSEDESAKFPKEAMAGKVVPVCYKLRD